MVRIRYDPDSCHLSARGHAGAGDKGEDLVCAAVSALVLALCQAVTELEEAGDARILELTAQPGAAAVTCRPAPGREDYLRGVFRTPGEGMRLLANMFPGYVTVER